MLAMLAVMASTSIEFDGYVGYIGQEVFADLGEIDGRWSFEEFFIDFDKLRKGTCGEAAVSNACVLTVSSELASTLSGSTLRLLR